MPSLTELRAKSECLEWRCEIVIDYGFQKENGSQSEWRMKKNELSHISPELVRERVLAYAVLFLP